MYTPGAFLPTRPKRYIMLFYGTGIVKNFLSLNMVGKYTGFICKPVSITQYKLSTFIPTYNIVDVSIILILSGNS